MEQLTYLGNHMSVEHEQWSTNPDECILKTLFCTGVQWLDWTLYRSMLTMCPSVVRTVWSPPNQVDSCSKDCSTVILCWLHLQVHLVDLSIRLLHNALELNVTAALNCILHCSVQCKSAAVQCVIIQDCTLLQWTAMHIREQDENPLVLVCSPSPVILNKATLCTVNSVHEQYWTPVLMSKWVCLISSLKENRPVWYDLSPLSCYYCDSDFEYLGYLG